jgi:ketosteroid isomerase-like protein
MKPTLTLSTGIAVLALAACGPKAPDASAAAKATADVKTAVAQLVDGYNTRNLAEAIGVNAPDHLGMAHGFANVAAADAEQASVKAQLADPAMVLAFTDPAIEASASGDLAVYRATYHVTYTDPNTRRPATEVGNWVAVFKRQPDGTMKLSWEVMSDLPKSA